MTSVIRAQESDLLKVHSALKIVSAKSLKTFSTRSKIYSQARRPPGLTDSPEFHFAFF